MPHSSNTATARVGDVLDNLPAAQPLLQLCGLTHPSCQQRSLRSAAHAFGLDADGITARVARIERLSADARYAGAQKLSELVAQTYRRDYEQRLAALLPMAERVESVHDSHPSAPRGLAEALQELATLLRAHMPRESRQLAPDDDIDDPLAPATFRRLGHEHEDIQHLLHTIHALCDEFQPPEDACRLWRKLYTRLQPLILDLAENIAVEETLLYPRLSEQLAQPTVEARPR